MRADQKLVSIIIPTFNRANLIADTLISIKNQTHTNWECIIVDDGSTDDTEAVVNAFIKDDARFKFYKRPDHRSKGANACRNFGFEKSKGQFINWFDDDDVMLKDKLESQIRLLLENSNKPYSICQSQWYDSESKVTLGFRSKYIYSNNRFEDYCLGKIFWLTTAPVWRRTFIESNRLAFDESLHQSQEYDFHLKALYMNDNYCYTNRPLVKIIKHKDSVSHNIFSTEAKILSHLKVRQRIFKNYGSNLSLKARKKMHANIVIQAKRLLICGKTKYAYKYLSLAINTLGHVDINMKQRLIFITRVYIALLSYSMLGKGYSLVKPIST